MKVAWVLKPEKENGRKCHQRRASLQHQYEQCLLWSPRQPFDGKERDDRNLSSHQDLPDVGRGPFVGLGSRPKHGDINKHRGEGAE